MRQQLLPNEEVLEKQLSPPGQMPIHSHSLDGKQKGPSPVKRVSSLSWIIIPSILLALLLLGTLFMVLGLLRTPLTYQSQAVRRGETALTITTTGGLQAKTYTVGFAGVGKLAEIDVKVGQQVKKNQLLAKLDAASLQNALNGAKTTVAAAQAALKNAQNYSKAASAASDASIRAAQTALDDAKSTLTKVQTQSQAALAEAQTTLSNAQIDLKQIQAQTQAQLAVAYDQEQQALHVCTTDPKAPPNCIQLAKDQYTLAQAQAATQVASAQNQVSFARSALATMQAQADAQIADAQSQVHTAQNVLTTTQKQGAAQKISAQGQVDTAQMQLNSAQTLLQTAQENMNNTLLKAPHDGTVAIVNDVTGGSDGAPSTSFFVQIVDLSTLEVQTLVNEVDIGRVAVGEGASFSVRAYGDRLFRGVVRTISPLGQRVSNAVNYMVLIDVDTQDREIANLLPGMTADVTIMTAERSNVLLVPVKAVIFARSAVGPSTGSHKSGLIDQQQAQDALAKAEQMLLDLQQANQDVLKNNPVPAFLLESRNNPILVKPVVLGLTNGTFYEVLAGLSIDDTVLVGEQDR